MQTITIDQALQHVGEEVALIVVVVETVIVIAIAAVAVK